MVGWGIMGLISLIVAINVICLTMTSFYWVKKLLFNTIHAKRIARIKAEREHDQLMECLANDLPQRRKSVKKSIVAPPDLG